MSTTIGIGAAMEVSFWISVLLIVYPYVLYPPVVFLLGCLRPRPVRIHPWEPIVTVLIAAYNEASCIAATIRNKLDQAYPKAKLQILVVSDGSTDGTDDIVHEFADRGVRLLRRENREGKAAALNAAVRLAEGEIIVFSDANSMFDKDAIRHMVENFADSDVGYVTGSLAFLADEASTSGSGSSAYVRYEDLIRLAETKLGSIIGVNGGVDAVRRDLYSDTPNNLITDFVLPLSVIAAGRRVVFDPRVKSREAANSDLSLEFRMRVRVALRALQGIAYMRRLLNPLRFPLVSFCLTSHKLIRYLGFVFLLLSLALNVALAAIKPVYGILLAGQLTLYLLALLELLGRRPRCMRRFTVIPAYVLMSYAAFAMASFKFLRGDTMAIWRPRAG